MERRMLCICEQGGDSVCERGECDQFSILSLPIASPPPSSFI